MQDNQNYTNFDQEKPNIPNSQPQQPPTSASFSQNESVHLYSGNQPIPNNGQYIPFNHQAQLSIPAQPYQYHYSQVALSQPGSGIPGQYNVPAMYGNYPMPHNNGEARVTEIEASIKKDYTWFTCMIWYGAFVGGINFLTVYFNPEVAEIDTNDSVWGLNCLEYLCLMIACIFAIKAKHKLQSRGMKTALVFMYITIIWYFIGALAFDINKSAEMRNMRRDQVAMYYTLGNVCSMVYYYLMVSNASSVSKLLFERDNIKFNNGMSQQV